jgi:hypothetical protein
MRLSATSSVFEANIRLMGGLLSAHVLASDEKRGLMPGWVARLRCCDGGHCLCCICNVAANDIRAADTMVSS